jgi:hypothetical protein
MTSILNLGEQRRNLVYKINHEADEDAVKSLMKTLGDLDSAIIACPIEDVAGIAVKLEVATDREEGDGSPTCDRAAKVALADAWRLAGAA